MIMTQVLEISDTRTLKPNNPFLQCEIAEGDNPDERALEKSLFNFASTHHTLGARLISIPPNRFFARHTHPNAYHFIYIIKGTGIIEYDQATYKMEPGQTCLVRKGVAHKLGAGKEGLQAIVVNTPTYDNGDPAHVHYVEEETLDSIEIE
jgi:quercetin dioxygenase-like cupin family protein